MSIRKRIFYIGCMFAAIFALAACRSSKQTSIPSPSQPEFTVRGDVEAVAWSEITLPVKVEMRAPTRFSASGKMYMRHDRDILVSMRFLSMEVGLVYVNQDSVYVVDKFHKVYISESIHDALAGISLSLGDIQDVLLGRVCPSLSDAGCSVTLDEPSGLISNLDFMVKGHSATFSYGGIEETDYGLFRQSVAAATSIGEYNLDLSLKYSFGNVRWSVPESVRFKLPQGCRRIEPASIMQSLNF